MGPQLTHSLLSMLSPALLDRVEDRTQYPDMGADGEGLWAQSQA